MESTESVGELRGRFHRYRGSKVLVTYHPSYLLRNAAATRDHWADIQILLKEMGIAIPKRVGALAVVFRAAKGDYVDSLHSSRCSALSRASVVLCRRFENLLRNLNVLTRLIFVAAPIKCERAIQRRQAFLKQSATLGALNAIVNLFDLSVQLVA